MIRGLELDRGDLVEGVVKPLVVVPGRISRRMTTDMDTTQRRLYDLFDPDRYAPRR